jgi:hypothetical protein
LGHFLGEFDMARRHGKKSHVGKTHGHGRPQRSALLRQLGRSSDDEGNTHEAMSVAGMAIGCPGRFWDRDGTEEITPGQRDKDI